MEVQLEIQELSNLKSQSATSSSAWGGRRKPTFVFTEHGAVMAANVLNSQIAIEASVPLVQTFIKMRSLLAEQEELRKRLHEIERLLSEGFKEHEQELREIRFAISQLELPPTQSSNELALIQEQRDNDGDDTSIALLSS